MLVVVLPSFVITIGFGGTGMSTLVSWEAFLMDFFVLEMPLRITGGGLLGSLPFGAVLSIVGCWLHGNFVFGVGL